MMMRVCDISSVPFGDVVPSGELPDGIWLAMVASGRRLDGVI